MNRQEKKSLVENLKSQFSASKSAVIVSYQGLTVHALQKLRRGLTAQGGKFKVAKARLLKRAADGNEQTNDLLPYCKGQVGIIFIASDSQTPAVLKFLNTFSKDHEALKLVVGSMESKLLDQATMVTLATLPSRDTLLAMVCGTLNAPLIKFICVLKQIAEKKQQ